MPRLLQLSIGNINDMTVAPTLIEPAKCRLTCHLGKCSDDTVAIYALLVAIAMRR